MRIVLTILLSGMATLALAQEPVPPATAPSSTAPALISASDKAAIDSAMNRDVTVEGVVALAEWSRSGKVMNVQFKDADESKLLAVIFEKNRAEIDGAFGGDVAKALTGSKVRIKGMLRPYGGKSEALKGRPQIIITRGDQITIVEPGAGAQAATTQPGK